MKASPLLRAWLARLEGQGVELRPRWRWTGWDGDACFFETPEGARLVRPRVTVLALGGAFDQMAVWRDRLLATASDAPDPSSTFRADDAMAPVADPQLRQPAQLGLL